MTITSSANIGISCLTHPLMSLDLSVPLAVDTTLYTHSFDPTGDDTHFMSVETGGENASFTCSDTTHLPSLWFSEALIDSGNSHSTAYQGSIAFPLAAREEAAIQAQTETALSFSEEWDSLVSDAKKSQQRRVAGLIVMSALSVAGGVALTSVFSIGMSIVYGFGFLGASMLATIFLQQRNQKSNIARLNEIKKSIPSLPQEERVPAAKGIIQAYFDATKDVMNGETLKKALIRTFIIWLNCSDGDSALEIMADLTQHLESSEDLTLRSAAGRLLMWVDITCENEHFYNHMDADQKAKMRDALVRHAHDEDSELKRVVNKILSHLSSQGPLR